MAVESQKSGWYTLVCTLVCSVHWCWGKGQDLKGVQGPDGLGEETVR